MRRIVINEFDNTTNGSDQSQLPIGAVFIPGFATGGTAGYGINQCKLCTSVSQFTSYFGDVCPVFAQNQYFPQKQETIILGTDKKSLVTGSGIPAWNEETEYTFDNRYCIHTITEGSTVYTNALLVLNVTTSTKGEFIQDEWTYKIESNMVAPISEGSLVTCDQKSYRFYTDTESFGRFAGFTNTGFPSYAIPSIDGEETRAIMYAKDTGDLSYMMAKTLLGLGMPVVYVRMNETSDDITVEQAYDWMTKYLRMDLVDETSTDVDRLIYENPLLDRGEFNIQFFTTGGYPAFEYSGNDIYANLITMASEKTVEYDDPSGDPIVLYGRGDSVVLLDHTNNPERTLIGRNSVYNVGSDQLNSTFASMFTPWCNVAFPEAGERSVPASFVYLTTVAANLATNNTWDIYAGVGRGRCSIRGINTLDTMTNRIADSYQGDLSTKAGHPSINAITYIRNHGYCIMGNRTYKIFNGKNGLATSMLNLRNLVSEIKRQAFVAAQDLMFDINDNVLWTTFKSRMETLMDEMKAASILANYTITKRESADKTKLAVTIVIYPNYGLESIDIALYIEDNNVVNLEIGGNE